MILAPVKIKALDDPRYLKNGYSNISLPKSRRNHQKYLKLVAYLVSERRIVRQGKTFTLDGD